MALMKTMHWQKRAVSNILKCRSADTNNQLKHLVDITSYKIWQVNCC